jgi:hypothetical protein
LKSFILQLAKIGKSKMYIAGLKNWRRELALKNADKNNKP